MPGTSDVNIEFDPKSFLDGLNKIVDRMDSMESSSKKTSKKMDSGLTSVLGKIGKMAIGFKLVQGLLNQMPEFGQAFGIAKDVILRNLLYPLRRFLFPMLQKILDWVRDNRSMFVRWGVAVTNVVRSVFSVAKQLWSMLTVIGKALMGFGERLFGKTIGGLEDLVNIITFKIAALFQFVISGAKSIYKALEPIFNFFGEMIQSFGTGLMSQLKKLPEAFGGIMEKASGLWETIKKIATKIFGTEESLKGWKSVFEFIGDVVGTVILGAFKGIELVVGAIDTVLQALMGFFESQGFKDFLSGIEGFANTIGDFFGGGEKPKLPSAAIGGTAGVLNRGRSQRVDDAIITSKGDVIRTSPEDTLIATKTPGGKTVNIDMSGIQVIVNGGTTEEGVNVANGLMDQLRLLYNREFEAGGL